MILIKLGTIVDKEMRTNTAALALNAELNEVKAAESNSRA